MGYFFWSKVSLHKKLLFGILLFLKFLNIVKFAFLELQNIFPILILLFDSYFGQFLSISYQFILNSKYRLISRVCQYFTLTEINCHFIR